MDEAVTVGEVMDREFLGVSEADELRETVELLVEAETGVAVVLRGRAPIGVLTDRDALTTLVLGDDESATVAAAMTDGVPTISPDSTLERAIEHLSVSGASQLLVTEDEAVEGVLTEHTVIETHAFAHRAGDAESSPMDRSQRESYEGKLLVGHPRDRYENQAICGACGTLARDLSSFNGQLLCGDCRDM